MVNVQDYIRGQIIFLFKAFSELVILMESNGNKNVSDNLLAKLEDYLVHVKKESETNDPELVAIQDSFETLRCLLHNLNNDPELQHPKTE